MKPDGLHQIGEVAERLGLSLRTVRFYEEAGLVAPSGRSQGGFRLYADADIERLTLVKKMKPLGFSVQEMRELLAVRDRLERGAEPEAVDRLASFARAATEKCGQLREQLAAAEDFAAGLKRDLRRQRRRARAA